VPVYPVHPVGTAYPEFADAQPAFPDATARIRREARPGRITETREPTPPLFKPLGEPGSAGASGARGGTIPPGPGTQPPPRDPDEPAPQSTTSPNTPMPEPSPLPGPVEVTPPANRDGTEIVDVLDADTTFHEDIPKRPPPARPFVEDGKTTQLSFTSQAHCFAISLEQYAALCAERDRCGEDGERERKIHKRYDIADKRARNLVDRVFKLRFDADPQLEAKWRELYARFDLRLAEAEG
jgi:hypothetical protein